MLIREPEKSPIIRFEPEGEDRLPAAIVFLIRLADAAATEGK